MSEMTAEEIGAALVQLLSECGLEALSVEVRPEGEPPFDDMPLVDLFVSLDGTTPDEVHRKMEAFRIDLNHRFGCDARTGYYSAAIGYGDVPEGQAMIEVDQLPFVLAKGTSAAIRA